MIFDQKKQITILITIIGTIFLLLAFFIVSPLLRKIEKKSEEFLLAKKELASLEIKSENIKNFRKFYQKNILDFEKINNLFINQEEPVDFISFLEKVSQETKVQIKISLLIGEKEKEVLWPSLSFQIYLLGSYQNFAKFIGKIETAPYLIEIKNITVNKLTETELKTKGFESFSPGDIKANILIKVYTKAEK